MIVKIRKGLSGCQRLNMAVVYTKYRSIDRMSASYLILSNLTLKNKLYKYIYIRIVQYYQPYTSDHDDFNILI